MNKEYLLESLQEILSSIQGRLEESPTYNNLKEQYESLTPRMRKLLSFCAIFVFLLILFSVPMSYIGSSEDHISDYSEKRQVIQGLVKYGSLSKSQATLPIDQSTEDLTKKVKSILDELKLLPEQIVSVETDRTLSKIVRPPVRQDNLKIDIKWINLSQVIEIGHKLQGLQKNLKLLGLEVKESSDKKDYLNAAYYLSAFSVARISMSKDEENRTKKRSKKSGKPKFKRRGSN